MHGGELQIYRLPDGMTGSDWVEQANARLVGIARHLPFMNHRLHRDPLNLGAPVWVSTKVNPRDHLRHIELPEPGDLATLEECCSTIYTERLTPGRPLWQHTLISGLEGNRVALLFKGSHAYADAQMQQAVHELLTDGGPDPEDLPLPEWLPTPSARALLADTAARVGDTLTEMPTRLRYFLQQNGLGDLSPAKPAAFNTAIDAQRHLTLLRLPLAPLLALAKQESCKFNDVFLTLVGGALARTEQVDLRALCSVALPAEGQLHKASNATASINFNLGTTTEDPITRLGLISEQSERAKATLRDLGEHAGWQPDLPGFGAATAAMLRVGDRSRLDRKVRWPFNVVLSNLRGPVQPPKLAGAELEASYFLSMLYHGLGLGVTWFSVGEHLNLNVTSSPAALPEPELLRQHFTESYEELAQNLQA